MSGQTKCGLAGSNGIGAAIALTGVIVFAVNLIMWGWHFLIDGATLLGFGTLAWLVIRARIWWLGFKARLTGQPIPYVQQLKQEPIWQPPPQQPIYQPRPQQQALPAASVHHHYGHTLQLGDGVSLEDVLKAARGDTEG